MKTSPLRPIIWSIAGHDTAGGAGLSADQRAADAMGVHLCPVVAAVTAQHSHGVESVHPVPTDQLHAQWSALRDDLPPAVIKTGLLGSVDAVLAVAGLIDLLRIQHPALPLVVDPVLGASAGGASFSDDAIVQAYREHLLPRTTLLTPNRREALKLLGLSTDDCTHDFPLSPHLADALKALGPRAIVITGGDDAHAHAHAAYSVDWLDTRHAHGWLSAPRIDTLHHHGTGCTFATGAAAALALGHVEADAVVLAKMLTHHALMHAHAAGKGAGPVKASAGFAAGPAAGGAPLPWLGLGQALPWRMDGARTSPSPSLFAPFAPFAPFTPPPDALYGILPTAELIQAAVYAGLHCLQLRHKATEGARAHIRASIATCRGTDVRLFINDHWREALALHASGDGLQHVHLGIHLGQEDLLALNADDVVLLKASASRVMLGLSSHSLWELARAAGCGPSYIACGPLQPTTTKDMPWRPQGADNLRWWVAQSPAPVVGIGGLLNGDDLRRFATSGAAALCVVRALGDSAAGMIEAAGALRAAMQTNIDQPPDGLPSDPPHAVLNR